MSVNGFLVDNTVQKYNYESLENYNTPDFSTSSTYQVGDYVMYQGKLYICTLAVATAGAWNSSNWTQSILSEDLKNTILIQGSQPTERTNKIWIPNNGQEEEQVPTWEEFNDLKSDLDEAIEDFAVPTQEAVDNWLTAHPEATTTVQNGSLTDVKFTDIERKRKMSFYSTLEEMKSDNSLIVGKWVHVFGECYPEYDGKDLDFLITNIENYYAIPLENGLYAEPIVSYANSMPYSPADAYNLIKCGLSYFDRSNLVYTAEGHSYESIFADEVATYTDNKHPIDCSTFAQACLQGITYGNSRFVGSENIPEPWGYKFPRGLPVSQIQDERTSGFTASELAFYAYLHGWLYEISTDGGNVMPGDFIFDSYEISRENEFREIGHVQVVFDKISQFDDGVRCIEVGSGISGANRYGNNICHIRAYRSGADTAIKYGARFPMQSSAKPKNITSISRRDLEYPQTITGIPVGTSGVVYTTENIIVGEVYTAVIRGDLSNLRNGWYPFLRLVNVTGGSIYNCASYANSLDGATNTMCISFTPLRDSNSATIFNALRLGINNFSGSGSLSIRVDDIQIYKGLFIGDEDEANVSVTLESGVTNNMLVVQGTKARFDITVPVSSYAGISIATVDLYNYGARDIPVSVIAATTGSGAITTRQVVTARVLYSENTLKLSLFSPVEGLTSVRVRFDIDFGS